MLPRLGGESAKIREVFLRRIAAPGVYPFLKIGETGNDRSVVIVRVEIALVIGGVYCELPVEKAMQALTCSRQTAINAFRELEQRQFIRRIRLGQGLNARIYVLRPPDIILPGLV